MRRRQAAAALAGWPLPGLAYAQAQAQAQAPAAPAIVRAAGSSTVAALLKPVADRFAATQPGVGFDIGGAGSSTALAGMLASADTLGLLSRPMSARERQQFQAQWGYPATELKVAVDAVGIYVFKANPLPALSVAQLRRVLGRDADAANRWGELGAGGDWAAMPIVRYGLPAGRGAYELVREVVLPGTDFAADIALEPVSTSVVQGVATQPGGIGYASVYFRTLRTRLLPIAVQGQAVEPTVANALSGQYPLARFLYVLANQAPGAGLPPATGRFLRYLLSRDGQEVVAAQGFSPLDAALGGAMTALLR